MLWHLSKKALTVLTQIFNHLLWMGYFPYSWKRATVIPIPKPNQPPTDPNSYRPISLLSIVGKLFEWIIASRLTAYVNQQHLLPHEQFGFRKKHSTVSQLARISDYISNGYNLHKHTSMVSLDIEKAYDTVWIYRLLYKLISLKLPTYLIFTLKAFLEGRSFTVCLNDAFSTPKNTPSGLPQGAVLSTTLFAIYISDMPHASTPNWHCTQTTLPCSLNLDEPIWSSKDSLMPWSYYTDISPSGNFVWISTKQTPYYLLSVVLPPRPHSSFNTPSFLGVHILDIWAWTSTLNSFSPNILNSVTHKATSVLLKLFPLLACDSMLSSYNKLTLYKLLIRPYLPMQPPSGAINRLPTIVIFNFFNPNVLESLAIIPDRLPSHTYTPLLTLNLFMSLFTVWQINFSTIVLLTLTLLSAK